ncbi:hypothetical protein LUZ60_000162 [Juncus effusus]|nr:hypothetical protein LUZ60_000162 [Juncus effusus]
MFLLNLSLDSKIHLAPMLEPVETLGGCVLTSSPTSPKCIIIFVLKNQNVMLHCRPKDKNWTKVKCNLSQEDFFDGEIVISKANLYARLTSSSRNCLVFTTIESLVTGTASWSSLWLDPYLNTFHNMPDQYLFRKQIVKHVVVSKEDVLLVVVLFYGRAVVEVCFFSFQIGEDGKPCWRREKGMNRCVFYLGGKNNMSFSINHDAMQHDCLYILRSYDEKELLYKIDMDDQTSVFKLIPDEVIMDRKNLCWIVPPRTRRIKKEIGTSSHMIRSIEEEENSSDISRQWADIPTDLLELLLSKLSLVDCIYIPTVCKSWSCVPNHLQEAKVWPWLMYCLKDSNLCKFIDPLYGKEYSMDLKFLGFDSDKIALHFSKDGWVLVSCGNGNNISISIINPFTRRVVKLPSCSLCSDSHSLSFSSVPTSPDFVVFGITFFALFTWRPGQEKWNDLNGSSNPGNFYFARNNPVFFLGEVYCLGRTGNLAVFDLETMECEVLDWPEPILSEKPAREKEDCYLMEIEGELISVFPNGGMEGSFRIFKLDQSEMDWIELDDLRDLTLFIDRRSSIAKRAPWESCANRIYFPRFDDDNKLGAFYSMETKKYYPKVYGLTEPLNCVWIEPNFNS